MFRPNSTCVLYKAGPKTVFGQGKPGVGVPEPCAIVKLNPAQKHTPISTHASASRSAAEELTADAVILLAPTTAAARNDIFAIDGTSYRIEAMFPQHALTGRLDHFEVHASVYPQSN